MNKKRALALILFLGAALLVHGNGKTNFFSRITGILRQGNSLRLDYTNDPGFTQVWLGTTNALRNTNNLWTLIATNFQTAQQTSNFFLVTNSPGAQAAFFRLLAPAPSAALVARLLAPAADERPAPGLAGTNVVIEVPPLP